MPSKKASGPKPSGAKSKEASPGTDSSYIVFGDDKKQGKKTSKSRVAAAEVEGPPKPTVKQIIGGSSWTGKLPVNLLSEHCQRQKWNKPDYSMRQLPGRDGHEKMYKSEVTLSRTDPKTRETTTLPTFRIPKELMSNAEEPSALEARHFAATYALFRVSSMKNISMALPPKYRDLWKEFQSIKKEDEKDGKGWLYDADPFAAEQKRVEIHHAMEKRKIEHEKKQEALAKNPALALHQMPRNREWERAPKIEMGSKIRRDLEKLVRERIVWNPFAIKPSKLEAETITHAVTSRGFRKSHVREALQYCADEEEVLEWLLIHVPEDDLPSFALPANYNAGISLATGDIAQEAKLKRLASAGFARDLCHEALNACEGDEHLAAFRLQATLWTSDDGDLNDDFDSLTEWESEDMTLEAIYSERYVKVGRYECSIALALSNNLTALARFIVGKNGYPWDLPAIQILSSGLPAYIRLSAAKQALEFAGTNFKGGPMVFNVCEWLEGNLQNLVNNPTNLTELYYPEKYSLNTTNNGARVSDAALPTRAKKVWKGKRNDQEMLSSWEARQAQSAQQAMLSKRKSLPAWLKQNEIMHAIAQHRITIITGETGSGKSTQVVQFVLDQAIQAFQGSSTNILCTQPRRVAALSLADRVSNERCTDLGSEVGYTIRGESKTSNSTKITFMTTGVLLRRMQTASNMQDALKDVSHIVVDEVHERSLDTDFLLALLRESLLSAPKVSIVLMSATLDKEIFMTYFGGPQQVAHVHIEGRAFPVADFHLEDVLQLTKFVSQSDEEEDQPVGKAMQALGPGINYDIIRSLVKAIHDDLRDADGGILIFLPGTLEIDRCIKVVSTLPNVVAYPLHASLPPSEQRKVFRAVPSGKRKVIAATNVAETSITIEDIVVVIDTGRVKETRYDVSSNLVRLEEVWTSLAACKQRRGRAGRVRAGKCYKLFTKKMEGQMAPKQMPEIQRVPLEQLCLSVKATRPGGSVSEFLASLITPPESGAVTHALEFLHTIGALEHDRLTALGSYLSIIPADLRCAKLLVYGIIFNVLEPCLTIASVLTAKDPFVSPRDRREEADAAKMSFPTQNGDLMLSLAVFEEYSQLSQKFIFKQMQSWCSENFLSLTTLRDIASTRSQLLDSLIDANLVPLDYTRSEAPKKGYSPLLLRSLISAALQPQIAEIRFPEKKYMQSLTGTKELDSEAKTLKYFLPPFGYGDVDNGLISSSSTTLNSRASTPEPSLGSSQTKFSEQTDTSWHRVFLHPSSPLFHSTPASFNTGSSSATYLSYFSKMASGATNAIFGPKTYINSVTPLNTYTQLLFGSGGIRIDTTIPGGGLIVSSHFKVRGWARIGVLVSRLRRILDEELRRAIDAPASERNFADSDVVRIIKWLVELNGQDR